MSFSDKPLKPLRPREPHLSHAPRAPRQARPKMSLKMQAIGFLSRREHSRQELRAKLLASLRRREREEAALAAAPMAGAKELAAVLHEQPSNDHSTARIGLLGDGLESESEPADPEVVVDELLDWLTAHKYLSETRFVESRVNARSRKRGTLLIKHELSQHGLAMEPEQAAALRETEFARAHALWQRKFGEVAAESSGRAKQARFLVARGFASDVVRRIVGGEEDF
jgi:regulatory protein